MPTIKLLPIHNSIVPKKDLYETFKRWFMPYCSIRQIEEVYLTLSKKHDRPFFNFHLVSYYLQQIDEFSHCIENPTDLKIASIFLFAEFVPFKKDSHLRSAIFAEEMLMYLQYKPERIQRIFGCIQSITHVQPYNNHADEKYFTDIYLSIFARSTLTHVNLIQLMKKEYAIYPETWFIRNRIHQISTMLTRNNLFFTFNFQTKYEDQIRKNFTWELNQIY